MDHHDVDLTLLVEGQHPLPILQSATVGVRRTHHQPHLLLALPQVVPFIKGTVQGLQVRRGHQLQRLLPAVGRTGGGQRLVQGRVQNFDLS